MQILDWLTGNANYRYSGRTMGDSTADIPSFHRLDLTATIGKPDWHGELQFGVLDVLDETDLAIFDQTATGIAQETPGQTFFIQFRTTF